MSRDRAIDYQEVLEELETRLRALKREQAIWGDSFHSWVTRHQIEAIEMQIAAIKEEIFYDAHPSLRQYRNYIRALPQIAAGVLLIVCIFWVNNVVRTSGNIVLIMLYTISSVIGATVVLYFVLRQYHYATKMQENELKRQIILAYPKLFQEIEDSISLLEDEA